MAFWVTATVAAADDGQHWWGYYDGEEQLTEFGTGTIENYDCAIFIPGDKGAAVGKKMAGIRVVVQGVADAQELEVWLSRDLPLTVSQATIGCYAVDLSAATEGSPLELMFPQPCQLTASGVYVGFSLETTDPFPILTTQPQTTQPNGFYLKTSQTYTSWVDVTNYRNGNVAIQVLLEGSFLENAVSLIAFPEAVVLCGEEAVLPITLRNEGSSSVNTIDYVVSDDGITQEERHLELASPIVGEKTTSVVELPFTVPSVARASEKTVTVTRVNGQTNESSTCSASGIIVAIDESAPRTSVMEEYTGTWCGWCPRGTVGLNLLERDFGDRFIGIAVHDGDPMSISDYASQKKLVSGYPSAFVNRQLAVDPYHGSSYGGGHETPYGIYSDVLILQQLLTPADVEVSAKWTSAAKTTFTAEALVTPRYDRPSLSPYTLGYVVLADSLYGEGADWAQNNDYAKVVFQGNYASEPNLGFLTEQPERITDIVYNDVAIAARGIDNGISGSVPAPFEKGVAIAHQQTFNMSNNALVQDKRHLRVVVLLFNSVTGEILNAAECNVVDAQQDVISTLEADTSADDSGRAYSLDGKLLQKAMRGISILRGSDGRVRKIISR